MASFYKFADATAHLKYVKYQANDNDCVNSYAYTQTLLKANKNDNDDDDDA